MLPLDFDAQKKDFMWTTKLNSSSPHKNCHIHFWKCFPVFSSLHIQHMNIVWYYSYWWDHMHIDKFYTDVEQQHHQLWYIDAIPLYEFFPTLDIILLLLLVVVAVFLSTVIVSARHDHKFYAYDKVNLIRKLLQKWWRRGKKNAWKKMRFERWRNDDDDDG